MIIREQHNTRLGVVSYNLHWHSECANNDDHVDDDYVDDDHVDDVDDDTMTRMKMMPFAHHKDKVSGLKSILRVVLPAGAVPKSDLPRGAVSGSDLIFYKNHATSTARAVPSTIHSSWRVILFILNSTRRVSLFILKSARRVSLPSLIPRRACHYYP